jgi:hypothetical protein
MACKRSRVRIPVAPPFDFVTFAVAIMANMKLSRNLQELIWIVVFGIAFGFTEAVTVDYVRSLLHIHGNYVVGDVTSSLNLGFIQFVTLRHPLLTAYTHTEMLREAATIIMLLAVAMLAARRWQQRIGAFLVGFAVWDIFYYVFLHVLIGWPNSLMTADIYFLLPVVWMGPIITPMAISLILWVSGTYLYLAHPDA